MIKFYDTCSLLQMQQAIFESKFLISSISLTELESIKTSGFKDEETKWAARQILHLLYQNEDKYKVVLYNSDIHDLLIKKLKLPDTNDSKIVAIALDSYIDNQDIVFCTGDLACYTIAKSICLPAEFTLDAKDKDNYTGYKEVQMNDEELANFYNNILQNNENHYGLKNNEYLLITDSSNKVIDKYKWAIDKYIKIQFTVAESQYFGRITPKDDYQQIALDSLANNQVTMLRGPAGTGKSYLAFGHMFSLLEHGKIDKIIIFCNTVATKGSAKLGFYPGSRTEKLLDSQIGNLLESKLGDRLIVEKLITDGKLILLPMSDIRGYDTTGMNAAIYISEAQNLDIELMRLALQRIGEDSICIIDGDDRTQVDMSMYAGMHNGMKRVSKVFRGADFYGETTLRNIHRSKIATLAQKL